MTEIKIENLTKKFNDLTVLNQVNCSFPKGQLTAILGPSGCGKTTLLNCVTGQLTPDEGLIYFGEAEMSKVPMGKRKAPMVHQELLLFPHMTVKDNINFGLRMAKVDTAIIEEKTNFLIKRMDLVKEASKYPQTLSGGQKQRVALARALAIEPTVLFLDEAFSKLDTNLRIDMGQFVRAIQKEMGITTVLVTHDQEESVALSDKIIIMLNGKIAQSGTPEDIFSKPKTLAVAKFLGKDNLLPATTVDGKIHFLEGAFLWEKANEGKGHVLIENKDICFRDRGISAQVMAIQYRGNNGYRYNLKAFGEDLVYNSHKPLPYQVGDQIFIAIDFENTVFYLGEGIE